MKFFLESTCACVLGPWPWPRAFLSLASRVSVLGKAVLGLESVCPRKGCPWPWAWLRIFFCVLGLGLEPCVLDSTSLRHQQEQQRQQLQVIIMSNRFVCASASTGASFYSNVTPLYSTGRGRPIPYRVETPSNSVGLAACSDRFLHKKTFWATR